VPDAMTKPAALVLTVALSWAVCAYATASQPQWTRVKEYTDDAKGGGYSPAIRYNHGAVVVGDDMIVTHGYFYNRETAVPEWLYDTWSINLAESEPHWKLIATAISPAQALPSYRAGNTPVLPSGRYGLSLSHYNGALYMFGGTDGGASKHGKSGYETGYDMNELWQLDLKSAKWALVEWEGKYSPTPRYLHSGVVLDGVLYVYGGNTDGAGDVVAFDFATKTWTQLVDEATGRAPGPGPRLGHTASVFKSSTTRGFLVYGGRRRGAHSAKLAGDVWLFDVEAGGWGSGPLVAMAPDGAPHPAGRIYHAMATVSLPSAQLSAKGWASAAVMTLGSVTTPVMSCNNEAWGMFVSANASMVAFTRLPDVPVGHYHHSLVAHGARVYGFGGHLCSTTKQDHPFYYLNHLEALDVADMLIPSMSTLRVVEREESHDEL